MNNKFEEGEKVKVKINSSIPDSVYDAEILEVPPFERKKRNCVETEHRYRIMIEDKQIYYAEEVQLKKRNNT